MGRDQVMLEEEIDEQPSHSVRLDSFWIDQHEVTNEMYAEFLNEKGNELEGHWLYSNNGEFTRIDELDGIWTVQPGSVDHPVNGVSWFGASAYCEWVGRRLPTEAEWEKAARGELEGKKYPWGDEDPVCAHGAENGAQFDGCGGETVPVMSFAPNGYGLYDMAGNIWEWVNDWYKKDYYTNSPGENPHGPSTGEKRVIRGGSWKHIKELMATYTREEAFPSGDGVELIYLYGFRCAQDGP